ncbi:MAG TPA: YihY family inner membrane protein [Gammaproteobacteria bacterium]|nr:YihY family inner membrane protein [Gammaproteobacteria bacterium]
MAMKIQQLLLAARQFFYFCLHVLAQSKRNDIAQIAASLTFTSLLALVPLLSVAFSLFSILPLFSGWLDTVEQFVLNTFVPTVGEGVQNYVLDFVHRTAGLSTIGSIGLFVTAILLLNTIDVAFNRIWRVKRTPRTLIRLLLWLIFLLLGPLILAASLTATTFVMALPHVSEMLNSFGLQTMILTMLPMLATCLLLAVMYHWIPNIPVRWRHAFSGAAVAAILFEIAKYLFALYIAWFPTYELLYGALAAIPLLLIWIHVSWLIVLLGAEITYNLEIFQVPGKAGATDFELVQAFRLLGYLWQNEKRSGGGALSLDELKAKQEWQDTKLPALLEKLRLAGFVYKITKNNWRLTDNFAQLSLLDLYRRLAVSAPEKDGIWSKLDSWNVNLNRALDGLDEIEKQLARITLSSLYTAEKTGDNS